MRTMILDLFLRNRFTNEIRIKKIQIYMKLYEEL